MALPAPTLSSQPREILNLLSTQLGWADQARFQQLSSSIRPITQQKLERERLTQQLYQWSQLLPGMLGSKFEDNEHILQELNLETLELSPGEKEALQLARDSLQTPPSPLTAEEKEVLINKYLPLYRERMSVDLMAQPPTENEEDPATQADDYRTTMSTFLLGWDGPDVLDAATRTFDVACLTQAALGECSFENVLRIFAVDGDRYRQRSGVDIHPHLEADFREHSLLQLVVLRLTTESDWTLQDRLGGWGRLASVSRRNQSKAFSRAILLGSVIGLGISTKEGRKLEVTTIPHLPGLIQLLSVIGYDFRAEDETGRTYLKRCGSVLGDSGAAKEGFFQQQIQCLNLVIDRLLVQGELTPDVLAVLNRFLHHSLYHLRPPQKRIMEESRQRFRDHLSERGILLPPVESLPTQPLQLVYVPPAIDPNGIQLVPGELLHLPAAQ